MNVFQYSQIVEMNWKLNLENITDWKPEYTFYSDFAIAEYCEVYMGDIGAIANTYNDVIESWGGSYKVLAEIVITLNHKIWAFYGDEKAGCDAQYLGVSKDKGNQIGRVYDMLWKKAVEEYCKRYENDNDAMAYYYRVTD